jgi:hypothetical protein
VAQATITNRRTIKATPIVNGFITVATEGRFRKSPHRDKEADFGLKDAGLPQPATSEISCCDLWCRYYSTTGNRFQPAACNRHFEIVGPRRLWYNALSVAAPQRRAAQPLERTYAID